MIAFSVSSHEAWHAVRSPCDIKVVDSSIILPMHLMLQRYKKNFIIKQLGKFFCLRTLNAKKRPLCNEKILS